jgi:hypothetical protein
LRRKRGEGLGSGQFFLWSREGGAEPVGGTWNAVEYRIWMTELGQYSNNFGRSGFGRQFLSYYLEGCKRSVNCNAEFWVNCLAFAIKSRKTTGKLWWVCPIEGLSSGMLNLNQNYISCYLMTGGNNRLKSQHNVMLKEVTQNVASKF